MKSRILIAAGTFLALAGCMQSVPVTQPPVNVAVKASSAERQIFGFTEPTVRSFVKEGNTRKEVAGARCTLDSAEFRTSLITPAIVRMPIVKGRPTSMRISCDAGSMKGAKQFNPSLQGTMVTGTGTAGLVATVVSTAIVAGRDRWSYGTNGSVISVDLKTAE